MLEDPVVVAGDRAGADVGARTDARVADVGEVVRLGALLDDRVLDLDEVADMRVLGDLGTGPQAGERPDPGAAADVAALEMAEGVDGGAGLHRHIGPEDDVRADHHVAADDGVEREPDRRGIGQRRAVLHCRAPGTRLESSLGGGEIGAGVDAERLGLGAADGRRGEPPRTGERHHVGQIVLALGVVGAHLRKQREEQPRIRRHQPRVAQPDRALIGRCVPRLDDGSKAGRHR